MSLDSERIERLCTCRHLLSYAHTSRSEAATGRQAPRRLSEPNEPDCAGRRARHPQSRKPHRRTRRHCRPWDGNHVRLGAGTPAGRRACQRVRWTPDRQVPMNTYPHAYTSALTGNPAAPRRAHRLENPPHREQSPPTCLAAYRNAGPHGTRKTTPRGSGGRKHIRTRLELHRTNRARTSGRVRQTTNTFPTRPRSGVAATQQNGRTRRQLPPVGDGQSRTLGCRYARGQGAPVSAYAGPQTARSP